MEAILNWGCLSHVTIASATLIKPNQDMQYCLSVYFFYSSNNYYYSHIRAARKSLVHSQYWQRTLIGSRLAWRLGVSSTDAALCLKIHLMEVVKNRGQKQCFKVITSTDLVLAFVVSADSAMFICCFLPFCLIFHCLLWLPHYGPYSPCINSSVD